MSIRRLLLLIMIFACVFTIIGSASDKIKGKIINSDGSSYSGKHIKIQRLDGPPKEWEGTTGSDGSYEVDVGTDEHDGEHIYKLSKNDDGESEDRDIKPDEWHDDESGKHCDWTYIAPTLSLKKTANPMTYNLGDTITYTYEITNTGNSEIFGPIRVTDDKLGTIDPCGPISPSNPLSVNAKTSCTKTYIIKDSDMSLDSITNFAIAKDMTGGKTSNANAIIIKNNNPTPPAGIPEFPTIAMPIAAVMGIMFIMQRRKREE